MQRNLKLGVFLAVLAFSAKPASAAFVFGPFPDYAGTLTATASVTITSHFKANIPIPFDGTLHVDIRDYLHASVSVTVPVYAPSYLVVASSASMPFNQATDNVMITDIYAMNLTPAGNPTLTGFNAITPEFTPLVPESFVGNTGTVYTATEMISTVGALSTLLPGYDLSAFSSGDPNSIVYVEQTVLPAYQTVPEPGSLTLLGVGVIGLAGLGWRRRRGRSD